MRGCATPRPGRLCECTSWAPATPRLTRPNKQSSRWHGSAAWATSSTNAPPESRISRHFSSCARATRSWSSGPTRPATARRNSTPVYSPAGRCSRCSMRIAQRWRSCTSAGPGGVVTFRPEAAHAAADEMRAALFGTAAEVAHGLPPDFDADHFAARHGARAVTARQCEVFDRAVFASCTALSRVIRWARPCPLLRRLFRRRSRHRRAAHFCLGRSGEQAFPSPRRRLYADFSGWWWLGCSSW